MKKMVLIIMSVFLISTLVYAGTENVKAKSVLFSSDGKKVGIVTFTETPYGVLIIAEITNLLPGTHAFHIHEQGKCEPPFKSAGGHFNPYGKEHGILNSKGFHAGDLPNIHVGQNGKLTFEIVAHEVTLGKGENSLNDDNGSAIVIHEGADDYTSDPAGNAGTRIACGVINN